MEKTIELSELDPQHWKPTYILPDYYLVSDKGEVYSKQSKRLIRPRTTPNGYHHYTLAAKGEKYDLTAHKLVAKTFIPNPENKPCIDHMNGVRTDNRVSNLRWVTHKENTRNPLTFPKLQAGVRKHIKEINENKKVKVAAYKGGRFVGEFDSILDASRETGVSVTGVRYCVIGACKQSKGYTFKRVDVKLCS